MNAVSPEAYVFQASAQITSIPLSLLDRATGKLLRPFIIRVGNTALQITPNTTNPYIEFAASVQLDSGDFRHYPFDQYYVSVDYSASFGYGELDGTVEVGNFFVIVTFYQTTTSGWSTEVDSNIPASTSSNKDNSAIATFRSVRSGTIYIYLVIMFVGIWGVTVSVAYIGLIPFFIVML